jgi:hypothetical protein
MQRSALPLFFGGWVCAGMIEAKHLAGLCKVRGIITAAVIGYRVLSRNGSGPSTFDDPYIFEQLHPL